MATRVCNKKWIDIFNQKFEEFIKDMILIYPEDKDFKLMKNSFSLLKLADDKKPFEMFSLYGGIFEEPVKQRDEQFFLVNDYRDITVQESNLTHDLINKLKGYWGNLSVDNKEAIWKYLEIFFKLKQTILS